MATGWIRCEDKLPPPDIEVETKVDDEQGVRNITRLRWRKNHWWFPDMSMYIYYSPTHWRDTSSAKTYEQAVKQWNKTPNKMITFAPNTHPNGYPDRWLLADKFTILGTGFSEYDIKMLKDTLKRKRG